MAADGQTDADGAESAKRQPIPLHIALQNHLHAHHVTEGNVNDLAQALQDWDTRDRNINLPQSQVKVRITHSKLTYHSSEIDYQWCGEKMLMIKMRSFFSLVYLVNLLRFE